MTRKKEFVEPQLITIILHDYLHKTDFIAKLHLLFTLATPQTGLLSTKNPLIYLH